MDIERTHEIVKSLAEGRNPASGLPLDPQHVCQQPDVIRALDHALSFVEHEVRRERRLQRARLTLPRNTGRAWSIEEDRVLAQRYRVGTSIPDVATLRARTPGAITARLERLGLLPSVATTERRYRAND